ncbi:PIN domain-containing protein [Rhodopila globiformis]|nr:PIN domain-containing protein [Rhodopila globiformis]
MFILDTYILSAMMRLDRVPEVAAWMEAQDERRLFTATISQAEFFAGLAVMADGRRRRDLEKTAREMFDEFEERLLPFDQGAAMAYAALFAFRRQAGRPAAPHDLMIAAIARATGAYMVTRDVEGFAGCGVTVINPWAPA